MRADVRKANPDHFMSTVLPNHLKTFKTKWTDKGVLVFRLTGDENVEWTIDLPRAQVRRGGVEKRDAFVEMPLADFVDILTYGRPTDAQAESRLKIEGDANLLIELGAIIGQDN